MIELKNVCKNYGITKALQDVSFKIELPKDNEDSFIRAITDVTRGEVLIKN